MTEEVTAPEGAEAVAEDSGAPGLSINDIATLANLIDICSKRGAFEGGELESVGGLRNRVVAFLQSVAPPEEAEAEAEADADPEGREQPEDEA